MKNKLALFAIAAALSSGSAPLIREADKPTTPKNPNSPAARLAEKKRAMRAEKLKRNMKGGE